MEPWQFELAQPAMVKIGTTSRTKLSLGLSAASRVDVSKRQANGLPLEIGPLWHKVAGRGPSDGSAKISLDFPEVFL
jgi:hypothetical protein